jgi:hypothetical protein
MVVLFGCFIVVFHLGEKGVGAAGAGRNYNQ